MKRHRISAALTAAATAATMLVSMPQLLPAQAAEIIHDDFEIHFGGWCAQSPGLAADMVAAEGAGIDGSRALKIVGRTSAADYAFAKQYLDLQGGKEYEYSVRVFAEKAQKFTLSLAYTVNGADEENSTVVVLDEKTVPAGQWTELSGSFKAPAGSGLFKMMVNSDTADDFLIDEVSVVGEQKPAELVAEAAEVGIKDWIVNYGIRSGNILNGQTVGDQGILNILKKDCNAIECENETKPDATLSQNGSSGTTIAVRDNSFANIAKWCANNGMGFRGHTMVWHSQTPEWFFKENMGGNSGSYVSESVMNQRLENYIKAMFNMYATKYPNLNLYAYDVCNECMNDSNGGPRNKGYGNGASPWVSVYGDNHFIDKAFEYARLYAPKNCHLFYNDYNEYAGFKRDAILTTAKRIKAAGNLDGVGMQSHINANANDGWSGENAYLTAMKMYLEAGLEVQVTELDISVDGGKYSYDQQASRYANILKYAVNWNATHKDGARVTLFQVWGPNDAHSWLKSGSNALLYNSSNQPKAAYTALQKVVPESEWGDGTQFAGDAPIEIKEPEVDGDGYWFHYTFENGTEGFSGRSGNETLASTSSAAYAGSKSLSVTGRTAAWHGAAVDLNSRVFKAGEKYSFSAAVQLASGGSTETLHFTMQYKDSAGETQYIKIASGDGVKGEWVQLADTAFQIPSGASDCVIYIECDGEDASYYIDEVIGAPEGTAIKGPGKAAKLIYGDVTCDGVINAADLSAAKMGLKTGKFANNTAKRAADVDHDGNVELDDILQIRDFLLTKIKDFEIEVPKVDFSSMAQAFQGISLAKSWKYDGENNPLTTQRFGADPGWMVYKDRLYLYTTNDAFEYSGGSIKENSYDVGTINCISSADLVNWTDHGAIPVAARNGRTTGGVASWAGSSWAPDAAWKTIDGKDKFFLYFANSGGGIGVLTADAPTGPWKDPIGRALLTGASPNCSDVVWMFDPGVYYDETTDEAYLFFGGGRKDNVPAATPGTGRVVKLGKDMTSLAGNPVKNDLPYLFEDSSVIKIGDTWYYSYCANWNVPNGCNVNGVSFGNADIIYMTSKDPLSWKTSNLKGNVFKNTGTQQIDKGGNNHHSIVYFKGEYYVAYHARQQELRMRNGTSNNYRSTQLNKATYNSADGTITCKGDMKGVSQIEDFDPYQTVQATTMGQMAGVEVTGLGLNAYVNKIDKGDWIKVKGVNFKNGCKSFTVKGSTSTGCIIKVCAGGADGEAFAYAELKPGDTEVTFETLPMNDKTDITFVFSGSMDFYSWSFQ